MLAITIVLFVVPHNQQIVTIRQFFTYRIPLFRSQNLSIIKKLECTLYKALLAFILYSNSILCTFKSIQHMHYMVIYTIISCIILYSKSFTYILYSFWSHCEYILSTSILISSTITIKEWE